MEFKIWIGLALLVVSIQPRQVYSSRSHRHRRALLQMFSQLDCERGDCHPYRYLGHGCYCGAGGRGPPWMILMNVVDNMTTAITRYRPCVP